jgi:Subtilase family
MFLRFPIGQQLVACELQFLPLSLGIFGLQVVLKEGDMEELKTAVERIIDEGQGERRSVIVQMESGEKTNDQMLKIAAEVHHRRNLSLTARELLPAPQPKLEKLREVAGKKLTTSARNTLASAEASLAIQVGTVLLPIAARELMRSVGLEALTPLMNSELVKKALSETVSLKRKAEEAPFTARQAPKFWTSRSMVLNIKKDDLASLPETVPNIQSIYPNRILRLPSLVEVKKLPLYVLEEKASSWGVNRIGALGAWGAYNARGKGVRIAVLDTGVDADHPDLTGKVKEWAEFDKDGFQVPGSTAHDSDQHGTHCAGIIAGGNASGSWIGVAPEAELAVALVLSRGKGTDAQILAGIEWAIEKQVDVISMSLGGLTLDVEPPDPYTQALLSALAAGIPVITAIGNDGNQTTGTPGNDWFAFSVGATDHRDYPAGFSGGRTHILRKSKYLDPDVLPLIYSKPEVSAPGVAIQSSIPNGKWAAFNGTSMATPHVAEAAALLLSATEIGKRVPDAQRAFLLQDLLTGSVEELGESGQDHRYGFGRIDVLRAIGFAKDLGY